MLCVRLTLGHCSTHVINVFYVWEMSGCQSVNGECDLNFIFHAHRTFIHPYNYPRGSRGLHSLIFRYVRDRSVRDLPLMQGWLRPRSLNFFSQLSKQWLILSISVQMLCEWSGMNEIVDRMSIVYFRSDCGFHNYPYMVRGRTFLNSFSATIWRKWGQLSPKTLVFNIYYIYWTLGFHLFDIFAQIADILTFCLRTISSPRSLTRYPHDLDGFHWFIGRPNWEYITTRGEWLLSFMNGMFSRTHYICSNGNDIPQRLSSSDSSLQLQ